MPQQVDYMLEGTPSSTATTASVVSTPSGFTALTVSPGTGGSASYSDTYAQAGVTSLQVFTPGSGSSAVRLPFAAPSLQGAIRFYHRIQAELPAALVIGSVRHSGGQLFRIAISASGAALLQDSTGTTIATSAAGAWASGRWNRIEVVFTVATASTGIATLNVYDGNGDTPTGTASTTTGNLGTAQATSVDLAGPVTSSFTSGVTQWFDSVALEDGATSEIGPHVVVNTPPSVTITAPQVVPAGGAFTASVTAADPDGAIASYAWTVLSGSATATAAVSPVLSGAATPSVSGTAPSSPGLVRLQCVVTDNSGDSTVATTVVYVLRASGDILPLAADGVTADAWTRTGAATTDGAALGDALDTTYVVSPEYTSVESWEEFRLEPSAPRSNLSIAIRTRVTALGGTVVARLMDGGVQRQQWTITQGTSFADQTLTVASPGAITTWTNLWLRFAVVN